MTSPITILPAARMSGLSEYFFAKASQKVTALNAQGKTVINLGIGSPDLPPAQEVIEVLMEQAQNPTQHIYPSYTGLPALKQALAEWYSREYQVTLDATKNILPVAGSKEAIVFVTLALVDQGDAVLVPNPGYSTYSKAATIAGAKTVLYTLKEEHGYLPDEEELNQLDLSRVKMMWINYPNNPTGATASRKDLEKIVAFALKNNIVLVSDNPYSHLVFGQTRAESILSIPQAAPISLELNSFSKTYNMAGWRLGWVAGQTELVNLVANIYSNIETGIFLPIQTAGVTALSLPQSWIDQRNKIYEERRVVAQHILEALGCRVYSNHASLYLWAQVPKVANVEKNCFELVEKTGVFITPGSAFGSAGEGYVRIAICQPLEKLQQALKNVSRK